MHRANVWFEEGERQVWSVANAKLKRLNSGGKSEEKNLIIGNQSL